MTELARSQYDIIKAPDGRTYTKNHYGMHICQDIGHPWKGYKFAIDASGQRVILDPSGDPIAGRVVTDHGTLDANPYNDKRQDGLNYAKYIEYLNSDGTKQRSPL